MLEHIKGFKLLKKFKTFPQKKLPFKTSQNPLPDKIKPEPEDTRKGQPTRKKKRICCQFGKIETRRREGEREKRLAHTTRKL